MKLPRASVPIALASAVSLGAQVLFSLLMLRLFSPQAVGEFSVISQIAFFWTTLALAQSPLTLLADIHRPPARALRTALRGSLLRFALLLPLAWATVALSKAGQAGLALGWAAALALLQLGWYLAQAFSLRVTSAWSVALGRAAPPVIALVMAALVGSLSAKADETSLLWAAASAYAVGALWLLPARRQDASHPAESNTAHAQAPEPTQGDNRSATLRMVHTAADALTGTAILLVWQRSHGAAEAGHLAVLLRVLGFVPAVIHAAWAQSLLAQGTARHAHPLQAGLAGVALSAALGLACALAIWMQWLQPSWAGLMPYLAPLVLWQASACLLAAYSHLPFQQDRAQAYSYAAMAFDGLQLLVLCMPVMLAVSVPATSHAWWMSGASSVGLLSLVAWLSRLRPH